MKEISQDEFWAIYDTLPSNLKNAIFSEDTADAIWNICKLYDMEKASGLAKIVGRVLMGFLPPEMLTAVLQDKLELSEDIAKKMGMEIEHFIFNPVKNELDAFYRKGKTPPLREEGQNPPQQDEGDIYREQVE